MEKKSVGMMRWYEAYIEFRWKLLVCIGIGLLSYHLACDAHVDLIGFEGVHMEVEKQWEEIMYQENKENILLEWLYESSHESESEKGTGSARD